MIRYHKNSGQHTYFLAAPGWKLEQCANTSNNQARLLYSLDNR
jgi:hypothetical protein